MFLVHSRCLIPDEERKRQKEGGRGKIVIRVAKLPTGWLRKRVTTLYSLRWILIFFLNNKCYLLMGMMGRNWNAFALLMRM